MTDEVKTPEPVTEAPPAPAKSSMMEGLKPVPKPSTSAPASSAESSATQSQTQADWWLAEGVPGVGSKPEYLSPKYKTLADQARAYNELHKTWVNTQGAPEQYEFGEYGQYINAEDPAMQKFMNFAKQNRFSQDAFSEIVGTLVEYEKAKAPNIDKEIERLGPDGARKIETVQRWASNTFSQEALDTIGKIATNADVINLLDEMRQYAHHNATSIPGSQSAEVPFSRKTIKEIEDSIDYDKYKASSAYRQQIQREFAQTVGENE